MASDVRRIAVHPTLIESHQKREGTMSHPNTQPGVPTIREPRFANLAAFEQWLDGQLVELEERHADFCTPRSTWLERRQETNH